MKNHSIALFHFVIEQSAQNVVGFFRHASKALLPKKETATKQAICEQLLIGNACTHHKKSVQSILFLQYRNCSTTVLVGYLGAWVWVIIFLTDIWIYLQVIFNLFFNSCSVFID